MAKFKDITGQKFGKLTIITRDGINKDGNAIWKCECECGKIKNITIEHLKTKQKPSCGCSYGKTYWGKNRIGQKYARLIVVENIEPPTAQNEGGIWKCKCDCGKEKNIKGYSLQNGRTKSCGCLFKESHLKSAKNKRKFGEYTINTEYSNYKSSATHRKLGSLSKDEWLNIVFLPCYYCGDIDIRNRAKYDSNKIKLIGTVYSLEDIERYSVKMNGIDRIDSEKPYSIKNSVSCCGMCNWMKNHFPQQDFLNKIRQIYKHLNL
jgi:hypothetical protein